MEPFDREKFDQQQAERKLHWARFCWLNRYKLTSKGITYGELFEKTGGISLDQYKEQKQNEKARKQRAELGGPVTAGTV